MRLQDPGVLASEESEVGPDTSSHLLTPPDTSSHLLTVHMVVVSLNLSFQNLIAIHGFGMTSMKACAAVGKGRVIKNEASALGAKRKYVRRMVSFPLRNLCEIAAQRYGHYVE